MIVAEQFSFEAQRNLSTRQTELYEKVKSENLRKIRESFKEKENISNDKDSIEKETITNFFAALLGIEIPAKSSTSTASKKIKKKKSKKMKSKKSKKNKKKESKKSKNKLELS